ncbi:sulfite exporter TauE/SafE family protein [Lihuaxuella thermophila]|uniref:High-affinity nickel-transport protein n=1 Tax=Lihuaxuella thermophila TaxID=1173111 RepID=A0A1H8J5Z0_9BACL|nr:sulfite exporter TauE/SafE family protein [Lihuaxuella thermophila]SEN76353.1 High-affinity nickel-transport protein [Lihuaxuella thermophila]
METDLLSVLALGFLLGIKHAMEPDHVIAVSTIAGRSKKLWRSSLAGVFWGMGHSVTLFIVCMALILMKGTIPGKWALSLEFTVGLMLVYLGIVNIFSIKQDSVLPKHFHLRKPGRINSDHERRKVSYFQSALVGMVHGLAGSAAMVLLSMSTVRHAWEGALYILIFGAGTVVGMFLVTTMIGIPFVLTVKKGSIHQLLTRVTGAISTCFGFYYLYHLGITEGLFQLWIQ